MPLDSPEYITPAPDGSLYINDGGSRIRKVSADGTISTVAGGGSGGTYDDGVPATKVYLSFSGFSVDRQGNLYIADTQNHSIRKVNGDGIIEALT